MYLRLLGSLVLMALVASCHNGGGKDVTGAVNDSEIVTAAPMDTSIRPKDTAVAGCYSWINKRDTGSLQIDVKGSNVTGPMSYRIFEKDRNEGSFQGTIDGDKITGWYLFRSEGKMSVREVAFKIGKNQLWPAQGDVIMRGDTAMFKSPDNLKYDSTMAFRKQPCLL